MEAIGETIRNLLKEKGKSVKEFAEALGLQRPNAYRIFAQNSMDTELLLRISLFLEHDFFKEYSDMYTEYSARLHNKGAKDFTEQDYFALSETISN